MLVRVSSGESLLTDPMVRERARSGVSMETMTDCLASGCAGYWAGRLSRGCCMHCVVSRAAAGHLGCFQVCSDSANTAANDAGNQGPSMCRLLDRLGRRPSPVSMRSSTRCLFMARLNARSTSPGFSIEIPDCCSSLRWSRMSISTVPALSSTSGWLARSRAARAGDFSLASC